MNGDPIVRRCTAKAKRTGQQCAHSAMHGATVCHVHGGKAPQVQRKAAERLTEIRDKAMGVFLAQLNREEVPPPTALSAIRDLTDLVDRIEDRVAGRQSESVLDRWLDTMKSS